ncbi:phenylacetic acid degradation bifunctional protein PaaZ [Corynebacterium nuruki]|uniref:Phenylacetic acid degradation bifunctional protein PaaZ n=1 Tax=Corynebacterium nuruki TaxID=1032851 RepID=A0A3D4SYR7_9CORY|nr:phenylacetic acid degradation bifunctional protein PaaZ [Corynebacterium nuruki]HCT14436.1 phenylacetic acid degradation bifunctional protein PaaZ [Corynebacterium nuruki]
MTATAPGHTAQHADQTDVTILASYIADRWTTPDPTAPGATVTDITDASTGEVTAQTISGSPAATGFTTAAAVDHARTVGHRSLAAMTTHERALILKNLALFLNDHRDELYDLSYATGTTSRDNLIDIDGGIGTLFAFSSKGRREMPNANVIPDGPVEVLSRDGSFVARHIRTAIPGVAAQINAFNFPVWGMLEKFAPAFVAGVPSIVKPATQTAPVAVACVRLMTESGLLPAGSLQIIAGAGRDLIDQLDERDHLAFTGSADTARGLRGSDAVQVEGLRFSAEADSLNAALLAPDAAPGTPEFDAYIRILFTELTAKAGQKCTAVRRAIVPASHVEDVVAALTAKITDKVTVGDPRTDGTTMGPLVSKNQQRDVAAAVQTLVDAGATVRLGGGPLDDTEHSAGAFFAPTVLTVDDPRTPAVHDTEAFGPVVTVLGYDGIDEAIELANLGRGSLVASLVTHDTDTASRVATGIAALHGRLHLVDRDDAKTSTGHGSPLPTLVHGGPGRAGGGEELGGVRGIHHYMQRTAVQGSPDLLTAVTGEWVRGAATRTVTRADVEAGTGVHPFRKSLAELRIGDQLVSEPREITLEEIQAFADSTGDTFYAHTDEEAATANPFFPRRVAHGYLLVSWAAGLFVEPAPGPVLANYGLENLRFITPATYGDTIRVTLTAKRITPRVTDDYGEVCWDALITNQNDETVASYDVLTLVEKENTTYANWGDR